MSGSTGTGLVEGAGVGKAEGGMTVDRVKQLGDYEIEIFVKGASEGVRRTVRVLPTEPAR